MLPSLSLFAAPRVEQECVPFSSGRLGVAIDKEHVVRAVTLEVRDLFAKELKSGLQRETNQRAAVEVRFQRETARPGPAG